jgi:protein subunit release factor B
MINKEKEDQLKLRMQSLGIQEEDLIEKFILGSGKGGQKINKTSSCVYLKHVPSGIEIKCQKDRLQSMNRFFARRELCDQLEAQIKGEESKKIKEIEKIRRQKRKRSKRSKEKMLQDKKHHSDKKKSRLPPL